MPVNSLGNTPVFETKVGTITANAQTVAVDVRRASSMTVMMNATSLSGHNSTFEGSLDSTDGTDGTWFIFQVVRTNANTVETATGTLSATPTYAWRTSVNGINFFRVRATAHTSGTATWRFQRGSNAGEPVPAIQLTGNQPVAGAAAHSAAVSGNPVFVAGGVNTAVDTTLVANDVSRFTMTTSGQLLTVVGGLPEQTWQYTSILTTSATFAAKAATASLRNYVTDISFQNTNGVATQLQLIDNATVIAQWNAPANMDTPASIIFNTPRRAAAVNTAMNISCVTTGASVMVNIGGYVAM
ncbi:hypothetical protein HNR62_000300 [Oceanisphaera litoralis]|uniref:hypothetical protein n=1 Tax=Oceanisphaera litoralis TaxID=225144 RepID=UPI00195ADE2A|nr:hypothetical protein [Oceanisphaera litoralis]MBM7454471.1 hypothetical protein [Oceanisphaera litoralis]